MKVSLPLLCAVLVLTSGCGVRGYVGSSWRLNRANAELSRKMAELVAEQAALIRQYRECLARAEADPEVDCFGYPTAGEVLDSLSD